MCSCLMLSPAQVEMVGENVQLNENQSIEKAFRVDTTHIMSSCSFAVKFEPLEKCVVYVSVFCVIIRELTASN